MSIKIIDSIMGSGKTSYIIQMINNNPNKKYIYITPYLDEVQRIKRDCNGFEEPEANRKTGELKLHSLNNLLLQGKNVVSTHALFKLTNRDTIKALENHGYTLVMDEVAEVISSEDFKKSDLPTILKANLAHIDEKTGYLIWDDMEYDGAYNKIKRLCMSKSVIVINDTALVWIFPATIFKKFKESFICTYMFNAQIQRHYFDLNNISYKYYSVRDIGNKQYKLIDYIPNDDTTTIKDKINIYIGKKNDIGTVKSDKHKNSYTLLSSTWYSKADREQLKRIKNNLVGYFKNDLNNSPSELNIWTTFKKYQGDLQASPYTKGFLSCNMRATNLYKEKTAVAYTINKFMDVTVSNFFKLHHISITKELEKRYALSELLQFVWRSAIREGHKINLYVPSSRMRHILQDYLCVEHKD